MIDKKNLLKIGKIEKSHGIKGEVVLSLYDDYFDPNKLEFVILNIDNLFVPFFWESYRYKNNLAVLLKFFNIEDEVHAEFIEGCDVYCFKDTFDLQTQHFAIQSLENFKVYEEKHGFIGKISQIIETSHSIVLEIDNALLIPFHQDFVVDFDLAINSITLALPEGLLNLN